MNRGEWEEVSEQLIAEGWLRSRLTLRRKATEDDRMNGADARTGKHGNRPF